MGVATLRGTVDNLKAKRAAASDARNTVGVLKVENRIQVRPEDPRTDDDVADDIRAALKRDPFVERHETVVGFDEGSCYLYGTVDSWFEKLRAGELATRVAGVRKVDNQLIVRSAIPYAQDPYIDDWNIYDRPWYVYTSTKTFKSDHSIREDVKDELWWSPFVDSDQIQVSVEDGVVELSGEVDSWSEWRSARENAYEGGAVIVRNELEVESEDSTDSKQDEQ
jgi:osmotically-inducible protein OsmY